jgi:hypothetical protein
MNQMRKIMTRFRQSSEGDIDICITNTLHGLLFHGDIADRILNVSSYYLAVQFTNASSNNNHNAIEVEGILRQKVSEN